MLTQDMMTTLWPAASRAAPGLTEGIVSTAPAVFAANDMADPVAIAHAMAQFSHECLGGTMLVEDLDYSAAGLMTTWPSRFDAAKAASFARKPERIANAVYNGRLGNRPDSDDGWIFRGRGGAQTTGRANYQRLGGRIGLNLSSQPDMVNDPAHFLACAVGQFVLCGCLPFALRDDLGGVTYHLNGGFIGLADRQLWLNRWKDALCTPTAGPGTLWLQRRLNLWGQEPPLMMDGAFGPITQGALRSFQINQGLMADGYLSAATIAALEQTPPS
jgi:putative chitinase